MRVIVVGAGKVGTYVAADLAKNGHDVVLLEEDRAIARLRQMDPTLAGVDVRACDACELARLNEVGMDTADVVAAVTGDDN